MSPFIPLLRSIDQLGDPAFAGVLLRSLGWAALAFLGLVAASVWGADWLVRAAIEDGGVLAWAAGVLGGLVALFAAFWLFLPVAAVIATFYLETIATAVERRYYPGLPPCAGAGLVTQGLDGLALGLLVLVLSIVALTLAFLLPGVGWALGWAVTAWALGRGFYMAVAMRRMGWQEASMSYQHDRGAIFMQGAILAVIGIVPLVNLLVPVLGTAMMVHFVTAQAAHRPLVRGR